MDSSKQLSNTLKMKLMDAHKTGKGYKKIVKHFHEAISSVCNVIKKLQLTVEVKLKT